ncbi:uncharacterized protein LOC126764133 [Bactrocera neohumeralis]|uniref:uncharacterized protein LOC126764133 n=1 Tax=Bactrocera neohumeralis TaxID=98809 RepID=UPI0021650865|nr:uncharacterized protein LOC126764133 [Bactrocera neohumeralis]
MFSKRQYSQKFRDFWLKDPILKDWLQVVEDNDGNKVAKCRVAESLYRFKKSYNNQRKKMLRLTRFIQNFLSNQYVDTKVSKTKEAGLSLFTAMHTSVCVIDHLGQAINHSLTNEEDKIKLHRTKCSNIIMNVWAPHFSDLLKEDLKGQPYSIIIDESIDIMKNLGIVIIYYSNRFEKVVSTYLDLVRLNDCDANSIVSAIKDVLQRFESQLINMMGIGTDNASVMTGVNEGVYAKLKREVPHLNLIRCICHSLQLAVSSAAKLFLPRNLEYIISETYNWFSRSVSRQAKYKDLYKAINDGKTH